MPANLCPENMVKVKNHTLSVSLSLSVSVFLSVSNFCDILACLQVENINCPLMFIVGEDDLSSASKENADVVRTFTAVHFILVDLVGPKTHVVLVLRLRRP